MIQRVRGVTCPDTGRDIADLLNAAASRHGFEPVGFLGGAIAESGLAEHAARERAWPDVSYGLFQPTVKWHGKIVPGVELARDGTVADTERNRSLVRQYFFDAARSIAYVAPLYAALVQRWGDPLEAWCRWNKPNIAGIDNPHRATYTRGLAEAERYGATQEATPMPDPQTQPTPPNPALEPWDAPGDEDAKHRVEEQIHLLIENQRRILMGKWDEARMFLDAIDPNMAGKWTNAEFPPKG